MTLASTAALMNAARAQRRGVLAFNVITLEHAEAVIAGAEAAGAAVIVQISENAVRYHGLVEPLAAACAALARPARTDIALHLDHVQDDTLLRRAAETGFSSVMYDASALDYLDNVAATRAAAEWAHANGLYIEAELGAIGGKGGAHTPGVRTDPGEAVDYVAATGVDALAVAVGSTHAMLERTTVLDLDLISRLHARLPVPLVLHGCSGVSDPHLADAVQAGIVKVNIGTILNLAYTRCVRAELEANPDVVDPRSYLGKARDAVADEVARLVRAVDHARRAAPG